MACVPMRPPRRLDVPDIAAYMQCSANRELFKEPEPAIRRVSATSEAGGYPETVRGVLQSDRQIEATLSLQTAMFARASERQLAVAIGLDSPGRDLVRTYKDFRQARASWFFPPSKANSLYHYVNARVEFHDFDMHLHNMRLAVGDLSARPAGETAAQARVRKGLLAKYEACVKDHATRMLDAIGLYKDSLRRGEQRVTVRTRITSPQQHDDKYMAAALAAVEDRAKPFRNALDDGCLLPVETAEFKPRYSMLDPKDRQALWAPNFQEAAFEFYSFVPQIDIVATWRNNPKCRAYMFAHFTDCLYMCVIAVETDRRSMDGLLGMTTSRLDAGDLPEMVGEFHIAVRDFNRAYNAGNPDARVESIGEFYVEPGAYAAEGVGGTNAMDDLTTTLGRTSLAVSRRERGAE